MADLVVPNPARVVALTQTTLAVDDVREILERLRDRFPSLEVPPKRYLVCDDQPPVGLKALAQQSDLVLVIGSRASSNSNRSGGSGARRPAASRAWWSRPKDPSGTGSRARRPWASAPPRVHSR